MKFNSFMDYIYRYAPKEFTDATPNLNVKYKEYLSLRGRHIMYGDFTSFVLKDGVYTPVFALSDEEVINSDKVDLLPLICVGCAEIAKTLDFMVREDLSKYYSIKMLTMTKPVNYWSLTRIMKKAVRAYHFSGDNVVGFNMLYALKSPYAGKDFGNIKSTANCLYSLALTEPKVFCRMVVDLAYAAYTCMPALVGTENMPDDYYEYISLPAVKRSMGYVDERFWDFGAVSYNSPSGKGTHRITDGRGTSIFLTTILFANLYNICGERSSSKTIMYNFGQDILSVLQDRFNRCVGDDWVGRVLSGRKARLRKSESSGIDTMMHGVCQTTSVQYKVGTNDVFRDMYDSMYMSGVASCSGVSLELGTSTFYSSAGDIMFALYRLYDKSDNYFVSRNVDNVIESMYKDIDDNGFVVEFDDCDIVYEKNESDNDIAKYKSWLLASESEVEVLKSRLENLTSSFEQEKRNLQYQIDRKSEIIENLSTEIEELNTELGKCYASEEYDPVVENSGITIEEAIETIKNYKILLVGGHYDMIQKLEKYGVSGNISQVYDMRKVNGEVCDFICVNTTFTSHSLIGCVKSRYTDFLDKLYYFNGTNAEVFIYATYDYIKKSTGGVSTE